MNQHIKFFAILSLCIVVILGFYASNSFCGDAIDDLRISAEQGDARAQFGLGLAYHLGEGVPKDVSVAAKWYLKAAEQGYADAQYYIALCYDEGQGVPKDLTEAAKWFRKAAEQGHAYSQYALALCYEKGEGVAKNSVEAIKWFLKAAEQGDDAAQYALSVRYKKGEGVAKNLVEAFKWCRKAAEQGYSRAQYSLALYYEKGEGVSKNLVEAAKWYRKAAEQGDPAAQFALAVCYHYGQGVPKNLVEAFKWCRKAAEQNYPKAQGALGASYFSGEGVPKDEIEALAWFNIAAASGDQHAADTRKMLEKQLGRQATLLSQQRSKEIIKEIETKKQKREKTEESGQKYSQPENEITGSGTGVIVGSNGLILTAAHVVGQSTEVKIATHKGVKTARVVKLDTANDVALLVCDGSFKAVPLKSSTGIKLGQSVFTIGFPNIGFQGFSPKMTRGEINSLSGLQDDPRHWQISLPIQPGNSGGPLFDDAGNVIGVVLSKLNALKVAKYTGDLPQNVNYALKSIYAYPLLESYDANLIQENKTSISTKALESVVEKVKDSVVLILVYQ